MERWSKRPRGEVERKGGGAKRWGERRKREWEEGEKGRGGEKMRGGWEERCLRGEEERKSVNQLKASGSQDKGMKGFLLE